MHATLYLMRPEMGSQCSFFRRVVEWWWRGAMRMSCSKGSNFLERLDDRNGCAQEETVTVIKPWENIGDNKSFGCIFSEKSADWTNMLELEISSLTDFYDVFFMDNSESRMNQRFLAESEKGILWPPRVIESGREMVAISKKKRRKKEELLFCNHWVWVDFLSFML